MARLTHLHVGGPVGELITINVAKLAEITAERRPKPKVWNKARVAAWGLPPIRLHDLRHGTATHALTAGVPIKIVSDLLGHSGYLITADTHTSVADEAKRAAAHAIANLFAEAARKNASTREARTG